MGRYVGLGTKKARRAMSEPLINEVLPVDLPTQNTGRGNRWFSSARARKRWEDQLEDYVRCPLDVTVHLEYVRVVGPGQRAWDADNLALALKQLQDALVSLGWFHTTALSGFGP